MRSLNAQATRTCIGTKTPAGQRRNVGPPWAALIRARPARWATGQPAVVPAPAPAPARPWPVPAPFPGGSDRVSGPVGTEQYGLKQAAVT
jgi:hypothetical protein